MQNQTSTPPPNPTTRLQQPSPLQNFFSDPYLQNVEPFNPQSLRFHPTNSEQFPDRSLEEILTDQVHRRTQENRRYERAYESPFPGRTIPGRNNKRAHKSQFSESPHESPIPERTHKSRSPERAHKSQFHERAHESPFPSYRSSNIIREQNPENDHKNQVPEHIPRSPFPERAHDGKDPDFRRTSPWPTGYETFNTAPQSTPIEAQRPQATRTPSYDPHTRFPTGSSVNVPLQPIPEETCSAVYKDNPAHIPLPNTDSNATNSNSLHHERGSFSPRLSSTQPPFTHQYGLHTRQNNYTSNPGYDPMTHIPAPFYPIPNPSFFEPHIQTPPLHAYIESVTDEDNQRAGLTHTHNTTSPTTYYHPPTPTLARNTDIQLLRTHTSSPSIREARRGIQLTSDHHNETYFPRRNQTPIAERNIRPQPSNYFPQQSRQIPDSRVLDKEFANKELPDRGYPGGGFPGGGRHSRGLLRPMFMAAGTLPDLALDTG